MSASKSRMQLLGRQAVVQQDGSVAVPLRVFGSEHNKPVSTVKALVQKHFGCEGVLDVGQEAQQQGEDKRLAKENQLLEFQAREQARAVTSARKQREERAAAQAKADELVQRVRAAKQYGKQVRHHAGNKAHSPATGQQPPPSSSARQERPATPPLPQQGSAVATGTSAAGLGSAARSSFSTAPAAAAANAVLGAEAAAAAPPKLGSAGQQQGHNQADSGWVADVTLRALAPSISPSSTAWPLAGAWPEGWGPALQAGHAGAAVGLQERKHSQQGHPGARPVRAASPGPEERPRSSRSSASFGSGSSRGSGASGDAGWRGKGRDKGRPEGRRGREREQSLGISDASVSSDSSCSSSGRHSSGSSSTGSGSRIAAGGAGRARGSVGSLDSIAQGRGFTEAGSSSSASLHSLLPQQRSGSDVAGVTVRAFSGGSGASSDGGFSAACVPYPGASEVQLSVREVAAGLRGGRTEERQPAAPDGHGAGAAGASASDLNHDPGAFLAAQAAAQAMEPASASAAGLDPMAAARLRLLSHARQPPALQGVPQTAEGLVRTGTSVLPSAPGQDQERGFSSQLAWQQGFSTETSFQPLAAAAKGAGAGSDAARQAHSTRHAMAAASTGGAAVWSDAGRTDVGVEHVGGAAAAEAVPGGQDTPWPYQGLPLPDAQPPVQLVGGTHQATGTQVKVAKHPGLLQLLQATTGTTGATAPATAARPAAAQPARRVMFEGHLLPARVSVSDPEGMRLVANKVQSMSLALPPLCSCSVTDPFDVRYVWRCGRNCPLYARPSLYERLLNDLLVTNKVLI